MAEWCIGVFQTFMKFVGTGWLHWVLATAVLAVWGFRNKEIRYKITYPLILVLIIFFNPVIYGIIGTRFMNGMYWRMLWLVPVGVILAYGAVMLYSVINNRILKMVSVLASAAVIALAGEPVYTAGNFIPAQNVYQIPQVTIDVADVIINDMQDTDTCMIVVPDELLCSVRQYTTRVNLLYGRNAYGYIEEMGDMQAVVHDEMIKESPDVEKTAAYCKAKNVVYIVFNSIYHKDYQDISMHGYEFNASIDGYDIYKLTE